MTQMGQMVQAREVSGEARADYYKKGQKLGQS